MYLFRPTGTLVLLHWEHYSLIKRYRCSVLVLNLIVKNDHLKHDSADQHLLLIWWFGNVLYSGLTGFLLRHTRIWIIKGGNTLSRKESTLTTGKQIQRWYQRAGLTVDVQVMRVGSAVHFTFRVSFYRIPTGGACQYLLPPHPVYSGGERETWHTAISHLQLKWITNTIYVPFH